jgi:hypothetical protein
MSEDKIKSAIAAMIYQKFGELYFGDSDAEYFLDCLSYLAGDDSFKQKAIDHVGEDFINDCLGC